MADYGLYLERQRAAAEEAERRRRNIEYFYYSDDYDCPNYIYRHVIIPKKMVYWPRGAILSEMEWRNLGVRQGVGWEIYMAHEPEPHILLFRRRKTTAEKYEGQRESTPRPHPPTPQAEAFVKQQTPVQFRQ